jgi:hypothetical protein
MYFTESLLSFNTEKLLDLSKHYQRLASQTSYDDLRTFQAFKRAKLEIDCEIAKRKTRPTYTRLTDYRTGEPIYFDSSVVPLVVKQEKDPGYHYTLVVTNHGSYSVRETAAEVLSASGCSIYTPAPRWTAKIAP